MLLIALICTFFEAGRQPARSAKWQPPKDFSDQYYTTTSSGQNKRMQNISRVATMVETMSG
jgi:hypothetical protein